MIPPVYSIRPAHHGTYHTRVLVTHSTISTLASRIRIVGARPRRASTILLVRIHDIDDRSVCTTDHEEEAGNDDEEAPSNHKIPLSSPRIVPIVVQPHAAHRLETHESAEKRTDQRDQTAEDRNSTGDDVRDDRDTTRAGEPESPVTEGGIGQMVGSSEHTDEDVFGGDLRG